MEGRAACPPWCEEDVRGFDGLLHRVTVGEVRLTRIGDSQTRRTVFAVRRRQARSRDEIAGLCADLVAAGELLHQEHARRPVRFQGNSVAPNHLVSALV